MLSQVEWGEYKIGDLFTLLKGRRKLTKEDLSSNGNITVYSSDTTNNGIMGYTEYCADYIIDQQSPIYLIFGDHTRAMHVATSDFCVMDNVKVLVPNFKKIRSLLFICSAWQKSIPNLGYSRHWSKAKCVKFFLPVKNGEIDFDFMERFIAELEAQRVAELEAYLTATGLKDYKLTVAEQKALDDFENLKWETFNLEKLFGKSTRGKRLKSDDRIAGDLPFVTAGEADEGISAFISNKVEIFEANTTTIDMFGSAKYRNYKYGADDHIAVVHTEKLSKFAAIFTTAAIHKSSHAGQFDYSRNFYAKDADELNILLPVNNNEPDYSAMEVLISAIQKLIVKDVVQYSDRKITATKQCCEAK